MQVKIIEEHGYNTALYGFSLSYKDRAIPVEDWWCSTTYCVTCAKARESCDQFRRNNRIIKTALANSKRGKGHNKFLRQIILWIDIEAPRYFWSEFDTYKVGTVAQSESTMHTLSKRGLTHKDFTDEAVPEFFDIDGFNSILKNGSVPIHAFKAELPESYLQRRVVTLNYEVLRQMIKQRKDHRLPEWKKFIGEIMEQVEHPEYLEDLL